MVRVTIEYDMDDTNKSLSDELVDWWRGNVDVQDLFSATAQWATPTTLVGDDTLTTIRINELDSQGEVK